MPKGLNEWGMFILAVFVAGVVINTAVNHFAPLQQVSGGF